MFINNVSKSVQIFFLFFLLCFQRAEQNRFHSCEKIVQNSLINFWQELRDHQYPDHQPGVPGHAVVDELGNPHHSLLLLALAGPAHHGPHTGDRDHHHDDSNGDDDGWSRECNRWATNRDNLSQAPLSLDDESTSHDDDGDEVDDRLVLS